MTTIRKVKVTLGLEYDAPIPAAPKNLIGHLTTGPRGFLRLLETQLGIPDKDESLTTRLIQYLSCLESKDNPERFYHASYQADPFSVARTLLQWRDDWYQAGWTGEFSSTVPTRLSDMAAVESQASSSVAPNLGQRIQRALHLLNNHHITIEQIDLADPLHHFSALWQTLIKATSAPLTELPSITPQAPENTDLGKMQRRLLDPTSEKASLQQDGTLLLIEAGSARESAPIIADLIQSELLKKQEVTVLCESRGELLDEALEATGACRLGFTAPSPWRPVFQVLPMALELLWAPLNATTLFRFLSHPVGPIPSRIRERLAAQVANTPGIGSESWTATLEECLQDEAEDKRDGYQDAISYWLECERANPLTGIATEVLAERAKSVLAWLMGVREATEDSDFYSLYAVAANQVTEFIAATERLAEHGNGKLTQDNVRRLIQDVRGTGVPLIDRHAEVVSGQPRALRAQHTACFTNPTQNVIWWDAQASDSIKRWPWNALERQALADNGVELQDENSRLEWLGQAWSRPILAASERCVLVTHEDGDRHHPILDQVTTGAEDLEIYSLSDAVTNQKLGTQLQSIDNQSLPEKQRWWNLPPGTAIHKRPQESYSSLQSLIYSPYQWLMRYGARIRPGSLTTLTEGNILRGNLAHSLIELYFETHQDIGTIQRTNIASWVDDNVQALLQSEGATLLDPGNQTESERFISQMKDALEDLVEHLQDAGAVRVETETHQTSNFIGGELNGYIDLLATLGDGSEVIIDIKWGGQKYRRESLTDSNYLQLAIYAHFRFRGLNKSLPALSYFIISDSWMLNLGHTAFPKAENVTPKNEENWGQFWQRFEASWHWRRNQLDKGQIEVTITNTEPTENSDSGEDGLPVPAANDNFNDYAALTGWEPNA